VHRELKGIKSTSYKGAYDGNNCRWLILACLLILPYILPALSAQTQKGKASYYAKKFTGRRTASGERLHHDSMTCAHRTYPFGTMLRVTNTSNGKQVIVRVTDRGPFIKGRIIDLSIRAARELGIISKGIAPVIVERYDPSVIPYKPEIEELDPPELELGTNDGYDTPLWAKTIEEIEAEAAQTEAEKKKTKKSKADKENTKEVKAEKSEDKKAEKSKKSKTKKTKAKKSKTKETKTKNDKTKSE